MHDVTNNLCGNEGGGLFSRNNAHNFSFRKKEEADLIAKTNRRQKREEKRKRKALTMFRKQEEDKVSMKIAREEQKLIKAQRQLESIRLLDELFDRIKVSSRRDVIFKHMY